MIAVEMDIQDVSVCVSFVEKESDHLTQCVKDELVVHE